MNTVLEVFSSFFGLSREIWTIFIKSTDFRMPPRIAHAHGAPLTPMPCLGTIFGHMLHGYITFGMRHLGGRGLVIACIAYLTAQAQAFSRSLSIGCTLHTWVFTSTFLEVSCISCVSSSCQTLRSGIWKWLVEPFVVINDCILPERSSAMSSG